MGSVSKYAPGSFSWVDLMSADAADAQDFYSRLLDWEIVEQDNGSGGIYTEFHQSGVPVAGMGEMNPEMKASGMPSVWNSYVTVQDVEAASQRAESLGATVMMPPMQVTDVGRMSVLADPEGAAFSLWEPGTHIGSRIVNEPNTLCWNELSSRNPSAAAQFYSDLFGWSIDADESGYRLIRNEGRENGGMLKLGADSDGVPANWMVYLAVEDCDATLAKATELGGSVVMGPLDIEPGRIGIVADRQGAMFTVMKVDAPD
jgi:hypothetical protein